MELKSVAKALQPNRSNGGGDYESNNQPIFFKSIQWSADGTCLITNSSNSHLNTFIVPVDLLEYRNEPHTLIPYTIIPSYEPVTASAGYPGFQLQDPSTALILSSMREHPIRLHSALTADLIASYPLVNSLTEQFISPHCLTFSTDGTTFIAGSDSLISIFTTSRPGDGPTNSLTTGPKSRRSGSFNPAMHMRGIVSALDIEPASKVLAVGTFNRGVGLYSNGGQGECLGVFSVEGTEADKHIGGQGVTQVRWSPCGCYLYIGERKSDGIMIYDIRKTGQLLSWAEGRGADTNQRLAFDLSAHQDQGVGSDDGGGRHELWAGGVDGRVRMWKDVHLQEGSVQPTEIWGAHQAAIGGVAVHPSGSVVASISGHRSLGYDSVDNEDESTVVRNLDNGLAIWSVH